MATLVLATGLTLALATPAGAAVIPVTTTNDSGVGSLRAAITASNDPTNDDTISFGPGVSGAINLASALPSLTDPVVIDGPGADVLTVRRDTGGDYRIFLVGVGATTTTIRGLTIANGDSTSSGGGIFSSGALTLTDSAVIGNTSSDIGGGIHNSGTLTVTGSTIAGNETTSLTGGGGIHGDGAVTIRNSTITDNTAAGATGAGGVRSGGGLTLENSTIAANTNTNGAGAANLARVGGGAANVKSTIVADPDGSSLNCIGTITSQGFNLEDANTCQFDELTDQFNIGPALGALQDNGGPTETMALRPASFAIDKGVAVLAPNDQRGLSRPADFAGVANPVGGDGSDVGAYERQPSGDLTVTNTNDAGPGSLREAIAEANLTGVDPDTIPFAPGLTGTINLASALPVLDEDVTIAGPGANLLTVRRDSGGSYRIFEVDVAVVTISGLTITNGATSGSGGGIRNVSGGLTLIDSAVVGNTAGSGGGVSSVNGQLNVRRTTIAANTATNPGAGGGINSAIGGLAVENSTVAGNTAAGDTSAGGIRTVADTATITNSTIAANTNSDVAGAANLRSEGVATDVKSTIIAGQAPGGSNCTGTITSQGFNLESANSCGFGQSSDLPNAAAGLGPLQDNGGPTQTLAPSISSPAIDKGLAAAGMTSDQRGLLRPVGFLSVVDAVGGDGTDIGAVEVQDTDADGIDDSLDNCPIDPNPDQANNDGDPQGDVCDPDDDNDSVDDTADRCDFLAGPAPSGCPSVKRKLTLKGPDSLQGKLKASEPACRKKQKIKLFEVRKGPDKKVDATRTDAKGRYSLDERPEPGRYRSIVSAKVIPDLAACGAAKSKVLELD